MPYITVRYPLPEPGRHVIVVVFVVLFLFFFIVVVILFILVVLITLVFIPRRRWILLKIPLMAALPSLGELEWRSLRTWTIGGVRVFAVFFFDRARRLGRRKGQSSLRTAGKQQRGFSK